MYRGEDLRWDLVLHLVQDLELASLRQLLRSGEFGALEIAADSY